MNPGSELLQGILDDDADDVRRLVYADWLEEHGDEDRAEFIRTQIRLNKVEDETLADRAALLEADLGSTWAAELPAWARQGYHFERGFVQKVTASVQDFVEHADELFAVAPVRGVSFTEARNRLTALARCPYLARLRTIDLGGNDLLDSSLYQLSRSEHLGNLRDLALGDNRIGSEGLYDLARSKAFPRLDCLHLWQNRVSYAGIRALVVSDLMRQIKLLYLAENPLGPDGVDAVAAAPNAGNLLALDLRACGVDFDALQSLIDSKMLMELRELYLGLNDLGDTVADLLATPTGLPSMNYLELWSNGLTEKTVWSLAKSPWVIRLRGLDLSGNPIGNEGARHLIESPYLARIQRLDLHSCGIQGPIVQELRYRFNGALIM